MAEGALGNGHELAVAPVGACREVGPVVFAGVEEEALRGRGEVWVCECGGDDAHEEVVVVDKEAGLVRPVVAAPAAAEGCRVGDAVEGGVEAARTGGELDEGEGACAAVGDAVARGRAGVVEGVGAIEEWIETGGGLEGFVAFMGAAVELAAGEAEEVVRVVFVLGDEEVRAVVGVSGLIEGAPVIWTEAVVEGSTRERETSSVCGRKVFGN
jgi:hypothetical protein